MENGITIEVLPVGAFRDIADAPVTLILPQGSKVRDVRQALKEEFARRQPHAKQHKLLDVSAFADEQSIIRDDHVLQDQSKLVILPPVSGG